MSSHNGDQGFGLYRDLFSGFPAGAAAAAASTPSKKGEDAGLQRQLQNMSKRLSELENAYKSQVSESDSEAPIVRALAAVPKDPRLLSPGTPGQSGRLTGTVAALPDASQEDRLDIALLGANPLVAFDGTSFIPMDNTGVSGTLLDAFQAVLSILERKQLSILVEAATSQNLWSVALKRPKVLHLSAHGSYAQNDFFLALEDHEKIGVMSPMYMAKMYEKLSYNFEMLLQNVDLGTCLYHRIGLYLTRIQCYQSACYIHRCVAWKPGFFDAAVADLFISWRVL